MEEEQVLWIDDPSKLTPWIFDDYKRVVVPINGINGTELLQKTAELAPSLANYDRGPIVMDLNFE